MPRRSKNSRQEILVTLPDSVVHHVSLPAKATGMDCLENICSQLGIVEVDYFGLRYVDHHGIYLWINLRMRLSIQMKSTSPCQLYLKVKYFVDPKCLQQPSTRHLFYLQVKALMAKGQLPVPIKEAPKIGALISQADLGDSTTLKDKLCYPQYFKDWAPGIARAIAKEHTKLTGIDKCEAQSQFLEKAFKLENWGVYYVKVVNTEENSSCYLGIGGLYIRVCSSQWRLVKKISYDYLLEASFRNKIFTIAYRSLNAQGQQIEKHLYFRCPHHRIARHLFRLLTEDHTFFCHETVSDRVLNHVRTRSWQEVGRKYFGRNYDKVYHFDILRTSHEAYSHAWERLHQVNQGDLSVQLNTTMRIQERASSPSTCTSSQTNSDLTSIVDLHETSSDLSQINLIRFGLSKSSCDIAKELLETPISDPSPSSSSSDIIHHTKTDCSTRGSVCLTKEGTAKLGQFIQKIVDSKLCRVCMDGPVSAVFCPCGHYISCYKCALECTRCPLCRSPIAYVQYVYGPGL